MDKTKQSVMAKYFVILGLFVFVPVMGFKGCVYNHHLKLVPKEFKIWRVIYSKEKTWGLGPGGNETGVVAYKLPSSQAKIIAQNGLSYLSELSMSRTGTDWRGVYRTWNATPIPKEDSSWFETSASNKPTEKPILDNYLERYNFGIDIEASIENDINSMIATPGSYYAYGRVGIILVAPSIGRVFYMYSG